MEQQKPVVSNPQILSQPATLAPVVKTAAVVKKQSGLRKFWGNFFAEDFKTVRSSVTENVIKPTVKNGIASILTSAIYMWLFGKNGAPGYGNGLFNRPLFNNSGGIINYNNMYKVQNGQIVPPGTVTQVGTGQTVSTFRSTDVYNPYMFAYASWQDAENVYVSLCQRIATYGVATVRNLYDLSGAVGADIITVDWGWYDLPNHQNIPNGDGTWCLKLPSPVSLKGAR